MNAVVRRVGAAVAAGVLLLSTTVLPAASPAAAAAPVMTMTVADVTPNSPPVTATPAPLAFTLALTNLTDRPIKNVVIAATRSDPIGNQVALDAAVAHPKPPSPDQEAPVKTTLGPMTVGLGSQSAVLHTTIDTATDAEVCECRDAIYPFYFTATVTGTDGRSQQLATAQTYLPSFSAAPVKARVGWLWPLLDRPHRIKQETLFTDDDLAEEIAAGGRLDNLLTVLEDVSAKVPMTIVTDPDLIDELAVMAGSTGYRVATAAGVVRHPSSVQAQDWLDRLTAVLSRPKIELAFTPFADPAVESLTRNHLRWRAGLGTAEARVTAALGGVAYPSDIAWPAGETASAATLSTLVSQGVSTVVLNDRTLTGAPSGSTLGTAADGSTHVVAPDALADVSTRGGHSVIAGVTSSPIERLVRKVLAPDGPGLSVLPQLVAQLAIRVVTSVNTPHYVLITPPRVLDVDPTIAERAILATASTTWSQPLPLREAAASGTPVDHGRLRAGLRAPALPARTIASVEYVGESIPTLKDLYASPTVAAAATEPLPAAIQRCESTSLMYDRAQSITFGSILRTSVANVRNGVQLIRPADGRYTLTSDNARLPVTVVNHEPQDVRIRLDVSGPEGFSAGTSEVRTVRANQRVQLRVPTHLTRVGVIEVHVTLTTKSGLALGSSIPLEIRSTALGTVGVIITVVAAVILAIALLLRIVRRFRHRRRADGPAGPNRPVPATPVLP